MSENLSSAAVVIGALRVKIIGYKREQKGEYDQEIPQSQAADQPTAP